MAIYFKGQEVGWNTIREIGEISSGETSSETPSTDITLTQTQWNDLQDAVEYRTGYEAVSSADIDDLVDQLNESYQIEMDTKIKYCHGDAATWTRPQGWPDLDSLNLEFTGNTDFIYMTYRVGHDDDFLAFHIELVGNTGTANVDFGHISNGSYVIDSTRTVSHNTNNYYYFNEENEGYIVVRITGSIKIFKLIIAAAANGTPDSRSFTALQQHMYERIAYVPNIINFCTNNQYWGTYDLEREKIGNGDGTACTSLYSLYNQCVHLREVDLSQFYTPNVTTLQSAFERCFSLKTLNINHFDVSKVTTLYNTFSTCYSLQTLNLSNWNITNKLTNMYATFNECRSLQQIIGLNNFDTSNVTTFYTIFSQCRSLTNLDDITNWNISKVTTMASMFSYCYNIQKLDLSQWNPTKVTNIGSMFANCYSLKEIKFPNNSTDNITAMNSCFSSCFLLQNIDVTWIKMSGGTCTAMGSMFYGCRSITRLDFPTNWNLTGIANANSSFTGVFQGCNSLKTITGIKNWNLSNCTTKDTNNIFNGCYALNNLDISGWQLNSTGYGGFFQQCYSLETVNISGFNTANCTTLASMFSDCWSLKSITYPSTWDTSKVTTMAGMFNGCFSLPTINIDFSTWDFSKVTTIASMFAYCTSLTSLSVNNWNLPLCTTIATVFNYCESLKEISFTGWSIPKVTTTSPGRFLASCWRLKKITGFPPIKLAFSMVDAFDLPAEEFVTLFNNLENTGGTARTLNISTQNLNRLSAAEKAIATNKGWTLAN